MMSVITEVERIVEHACGRETNVFGYSIWTHHIQQVARVGREIAPECEADPEIVELAALLHDYASVKSESLVAEHHVHGPVEAEKILCELGYPADRIEAVKYCIANHRASAESDRGTAEAECLANADAITHLQQVPSLLNYAFLQRGLDIDAGATWVRDKLQRTWRKLSPRFHERWRAKYEAALATLTVR